MKTRNYIALCLLALVSASACASTKISDRQTMVKEKLPRPENIWVYDFAATPAGVPAESSLAGRHTEHTTPQTQEQIDLGKKLGAEIAAHLVAEIRAMGMPGERGRKHRPRAPPLSQHRCST